MKNILILSISAFVIVISQSQNLQATYNYVPKKSSVDFDQINQQEQQRTQTYLLKEQVRIQQEQMKPQNQRKSWNI